MTRIERDDGSPYTAGDDLDCERDVTDITVTDPLVKAWLTVKTTPSAADPGTLQKIISTALVVGVGQIAQDGSEQDGNGTASLLFQLTAADTSALGASRTYHYDVQVKTQSGKIHTPEKGTLRLQAGITDASS